MELQAVDRFKWISSYYDDTPSNEFANKDKLFILQKAPPKKEEVYTGTANITKDGPYYNLKITTSTQVYEFESENEERFIRKFNELVESAGNIKWMIAGEVTAVLLSRLKTQRPSRSSSATPRNQLLPYPSPLKQSHPSKNRPSKSTTRRRRMRARAGRGGSESLLMAALSKRNKRIAGVHPCVS